MAYETVIGIETHVELATDSKIFCGCPARFGADPNTNVCPVCLGLPGALPVLNQQAIESIVAIGLALDCEIAVRSQFHRKNYFYADQPKNYQISQYDVPVCSGGVLELDADGATFLVRINRVHMEEDTGKMIHVGGHGRIKGADHSLLDFNRSGIPLVEIVTEPDLSTPQQARAFAQELQAIVLALGVSDAKLEEGSMRFDANVSLRPIGSDELGTKVEVKNMNSFRSLERALAFEIARQTSALDTGEKIVQETRHWDEAAGVTGSMRSKEESSDYRYFPEPDLVPIEVTESWREEIRRSLPEMPAARRARYEELGLDPAAIAVLVSGGPPLTGLLEDAVQDGADPKTVANWLTGEVGAYLRREAVQISDTPLTGGHLSDLAGLFAGGDLSATAAKQVLVGVLSGEGSPAEVAEARDLIQISDVGELAAQIDEVLDNHPEEYQRLKEGDAKVIGYLVGQVMRITAGKADPKVVSTILREKAAG
jgi:aspartyl-tRNA(Asn)/glutamyl-tRNA(Gln) amidotransferase subunit B